MKIKLSKVSLNVEISGSDSASEKTIFLFHGFTGSSDDWKQIIPKLNNRFKIIAVDLIGHGASDSTDDSSLYSTEAMVDQLSELIKHFTEKKIILAGYSMGGRLALSFAVKHPEMLQGLILESSSAGIKEESLRNERVAQDERIAGFIESHTLEEFIDYWMNIDLFKSQKYLPKEKLTDVRNSKLKNNKTGLANSLRGFSTGRMPFLKDEIKKIKCRTLLITGELDSKYTEINSEMVKVFPNSSHRIIKSAGHNTHLEQPAEFTGVINSFLKEF